MCHRPKIHSALNGRNSSFVWPTRRRGTDWLLVEAFAVEVAGADDVVGEQLHRHYRDTRHQGVAMRLNENVAPSSIGISSSYPYMSDIPTSESESTSSTGIVIGCPSQTTMAL